jgi:uncharacterized delta-60 repeat protein
MRRAIAVSWVMTLIAAGSVSAEPPGWCTGCLDPSFGSQGKVIVPFNLGGDLHDRANAIIRIPGSGQLAVAGQVASSSGVPGESDFGLALIGSDGVLDPGFGNLGAPGLTAFPFGLPSTAAAWDLAVVLQGSPAEWRLLVVGQTMDTGSSNIDMGLMYLEPDGTLDLLAPHTGRLTIGTNQGGDLADRLKAVAVFADQRTAVAVGTSDTSATTDAWMFYTIGEGFAVEIVPLASIPFATTAEVEDVATYPDGKIVAVGSRDQHGDGQMVVARLDSGGGLDPDFGTDGLVFIDVDLNGAADDRAFAVAVDHEGRVVVVGTIGTDLGPQVFVTRLLFGGQVDTNFATNGYLWLGQTGCEALEGRDVAFDPVGDVVVTSELSCGGDRDFNILRLGPDGEWLGQYWNTAIDLTPAGDDWARAVVVQPDGRIVTAGRVQSSGLDLDFGAVRQFTDVIFADGFDDNGWWGADWTWSP